MQRIFTEAHVLQEDYDLQEYDPSEEAAIRQYYPTLDGASIKAYLTLQRISQIRQKETSA